MYTEYIKYNIIYKTVTSHSKVDSFGRKIFDELQLGSGFVSRQFSYILGQATSEHIANNKLKSSPTTQLVSQIILSDGRTLSYEYDPEERITKVIDSVEGTTEYSYNSLGELFTETKNGEIVNKMIYTIHGNMTSKNGVAYTYGNNAWKDLLTKVGDQSITYDSQGNPLSYLGHTLTWEKGRQLKSFDNISFSYNISGIRTEKNVNGIKHAYMLDNKKLLQETWNSNTLIPLYNNHNKICGILFNSTPYYFLKNLQDDIIEITDKNGSVVAKYSYDAWGVCTVTQDSSGCNIANINPFRYRGYYFDTETNLYYLQSRYYNPQVGQFLNADEPSYVLSNHGNETLHSNLYCYCFNSPILRSDPKGQDAIWLQAPDSVNGLGHTGLLFENAGIWFYWSFFMLKPNEKEEITQIDFIEKVVVPYLMELNVWTIQQFIKKVFPYLNKEHQKTLHDVINTTVAARVDFEPMNNFPDNWKTSPSDIFKEVRSQFGYTYKNLLYIKGTFSSATLLYFVKEKANAKYNLLTNNCMQTTALGLSYGNFGPNSQLNQGRMIMASKMAIPNHAFNFLSMYFPNISEWPISTTASQC